MNNGYCHLTFQGPDFYCYVKEEPSQFCKLKHVDRSNPKSISISNRTNPLKPKPHQKKLV
jgi:hypothetical protein